jgi:hypothetical protein
MFGFLELVILGAFLLVAAIVIAVLTRSLGGGGIQEKPAIATTSPPGPETSRVIEPATAPYGIDRRPAPTGEDPEQLLPEQVGEFQRTDIEIPDDLGANSVYANYKAGRRHVFVELGICGSNANARRAIGRAKAETDAEFPDEPQELWLDREPSFLKTKNRLGAFMGWTRGAYYFSAHARGGEEDLDAFMEAFPY